MKRWAILTGIIALICLCIGAANAGTLFQALLDGSQEVPPVATPGTGLAKILLNDTETEIKVDLSFSGLVAPTVAAHIHGPAPFGVNAGIIFPLDLGAALGQMSGVIATQAFAINTTQVDWLKNGLLYVNVHTTTFPGGEIRGQIQPVPEPGSLATLLTMGGLSALGFLRRRKA